MSTNIVNSEMTIFYSIEKAENKSESLSINEFWENDGFQMLQVKFYKNETDPTKLNKINELSFITYAYTWNGLINNFPIKYEI